MLTGYVVLPNSMFTLQFHFGRFRGIRDCFLKILIYPEQMPKPRPRTQSSLGYFSKNSLSLIFEFWFFSPFQFKLLLQQQVLEHWTHKLGCQHRVEESLKEQHIPLACPVLLDNQLVCSNPRLCKEVSGRLCGVVDIIALYGLVTNSAWKVFCSSEIFSCCFRLPYTTKVNANRTDAKII